MSIESGSDVELGSDADSDDGVFDMFTGAVLQPSGSRISAGPKGLGEVASPPSGARIDDGFGCGHPFLNRTTFVS